MKPLRISVGWVLVVMFAVAVDCMALRSISIRPRGLTGTADVLLLGTLPTLNVLALLITLLVWRRVGSRSFWFGFLVCGALAASATIFKLNSLISHLEAMLAFTAFGDWLASSWIGASVFGYVVLPALLLLGQMVAAMAGGWLAHRLAAGSGPASAVAPRRRFELGASLLLTVLIAAPAVATEVVLRWTIDPMTARSSAGTIAVVDVKVGDGWRVTLSDGSTRMLSNGTVVRIDDDSRPSIFAGVRSTRGEQFGDHRPVMVSLLEGDRGGETTSVPRQFLRDRR